MKKGFTLIELLAVIVLTSLIMLIAVPAIFNAVNNKKDEISDYSKKMIYDAADLYVSDYSTLVTSGNDYCIVLEDLVEEGLLKAPVMDLKSDKEIPLTYFVKASFMDNQFEYTLTNTCTNTNIKDLLNS